MNTFAIILDIDACRRRGHRFVMTGSDKTPLKRNLQCIDCAIETKKTCYVAFGVLEKSWGVWIDRRRRDEDEPAGITGGEEVAS